MANRRGLVAIMSRLEEAGRWTITENELRALGVGFFNAEGLSDLKPCPREFPKADLSNLDLSKLDLSGIIFSGALLTGARLVSADLTNADLSKADITRADLSGVIGLDTANLSGITYSGQPEIVDAVKILSERLFAMVKSIHSSAGTHEPLQAMIDRIDQLAREAFD